MQNRNFNCEDVLVQQYFCFVRWIVVRLCCFCKFKIWLDKFAGGSTSLPGDNQVDGLPPAASFTHLPKIQFRFKYFSAQLWSMADSAVLTVLTGYPSINSKSWDQSRNYDVNFWRQKSIFGASAQDQPRSIRLSKNDVFTANSMIFK